MGSKRKVLAASVGAIAVFAGALLLWPKKASAGELATGKPDGEGVPVRPENPQQAYGLAMNPKLTNPDDVLALAKYLQESGASEWAAAAQKRYYDLKAEGLLSEGLKMQTSLARVESIARDLQSTHNDYAVILAMRAMVQRGDKPPPPPFNLTLLSGSGALAIDMRVYAPTTSAGGGVATPPTSPSVSPTAPIPTVQPQPSTVGPGPLPSANQPVLVQPSAETKGAGALAAEETKPDMDPNGTIKLAHVLISEQEKSNWKYVSDAVKAWQQKVGLTADGKFGAASALRMAQEVAVLPWVRYWSTKFSTKNEAVNDFRGRMKAFALSLPATRKEHAAALLIAADAENGQGWPTKTAASPAVVPSNMQIDRAIEILDRMR